MARKRPVRLNPGRRDLPTKPEIRAIHRNIKRRRTALNLTQEALADRVGVDKTAVSHWECGSSSPTNKRLLLVAEALETTVGALHREAV